MAKLNQSESGAPGPQSLASAQGHLASLPGSGAAQPEMFRALAEHSRDFIGMCDLDFQVFYINEAGRALVGLSSLEEARAARVPDYFFPDDRQYLREEFFPAVAREGSAEIEIRFRHFKTGAAVWVIHNAFRLLDAAGHLTGYATISRDVTERRAAEAARRESEQLFRLMFTDSSVGKAQADPATGRFLRVNPALCRITGYAEEQLLQRSFHDITHPEDRPEDRQRFQKLVRGETVGYTCQKRYVRPDGAVVWAEVTVNLLRDAAGRPVRSVAVIQDVTGRKETEEKVQAYQALLETVINSLPMQISLIHGRDLRLEFVNQSYQALAPGKQMLGRTLNEIWPETGRDFASLCRRVLDTGEAYQVHDQLNMICREPGGEPEPHYFSWSLHRVRLPGNAGWAILNPAWETTARKHAEQSLRDSELKYRRLHDSLRDAFVIVDMNGRIQDCNAVYEKMLGYSREELRSLSYLELTPPRWHALEARIVAEEILPLGSSGVYEKEYRRKNGTVFPVELRTFLIRDDNGQPVQMWAIVRDITDRKGAEATLAATRGQVQAIIDNTPAIVYAFDLEGRFLLANAALAALLKSTPAQMAGKGRREFMPPGDAERHVANDRRVIHEGVALNFEESSQLNNRTITWLTTKFPLRDASGNIYAVAGISTDVSERKRTEDALRESEERFRSLADGTPVLIWVHDAQGRLRFVNRAWTAFFGKTLAQASGENWKPLVHAEDHAGYVDEFLRCNAEHRDFHAQARVRGADGQWHWLESFGAPRFSGTGEFLGLAGSSVDITTRKEAEAVLARDKQQLEALVAERTAALRELVGELEHFSYSITHDMRAPLRAMMGFAELAKEFSLPEQHDQQLFLDRIQTAARRMDLLITDALNYSKAVRSELPLAPVDLGRLLRGMLDTYPELQAAHDGIRIHPDIPLVMGNEAGLTQCFSNMLDNAVKFAKPGAAVAIRIWGEALAGSHPDGNKGWVRIWVEDQGIGIPPHMLPRVFDMFARGSSQHSGTGIGLALVRKVVQRMGGRVGVESHEGAGSRFWVELTSGQPMNPKCTAPAAGGQGIE